METTSTFVGVDIGTSRVVVASKHSFDRKHLTEDINGFITLPAIPKIRASLNANTVPFVEYDDNIFVIGSQCLTFADIFNKDIRRPMANGCVNPDEPASQRLMEALLSQLLPTKPADGTILCFSVPSASAEGTVPKRAHLLHHEVMLTDLFTQMGYKAFPVQEGEAVVYSDLADTNYTGLAISFGAGLCNVALSYMAVPIITSSFPYGGDAIDSQVAAVVNEKASRVRIFKESQFSFIPTSSTSAMQEALRIFYIDLFTSLTGSLAAALRNTQSVPHIPQPIPVVLAGGAVLPQGFLPLFESVFLREKWPFDVSEIRLTRYPLHSVALGTLAYAEANHTSGV
jgi:hypothetical protein